MVIKGLLNPEELAAAVKGIDQLGTLTQVQAGLATYPMAFSQAAQQMDQPDNDLAAYFKQCEGLQGEFAGAMGVDVLGRVKEVLGMITKDMHMDVSRLNGYPGQLAEIPCASCNPNPAG